MKHYTLDEYIAEHNWRFDFDFDYFNSNGELDRVYITEKYASCNNNEATELLKVLQSQGFDEYSYLHDEDKEIMQSFVDEINKKSFSEAKENGKTVYRHYSLGVSSDIYKCCDTLLFYLLEHKDYEVTPGHGGRREGSGRKSQFIAGTSSIRVPAIEKDECRNLIDFLVAMQCQDTPVNDALSRIILDAELYIDEMVKLGLDMTEERKNIEIVRQLLNKLPFHFCIKNDNDTKSK